MPRAKLTLRRMSLLALISTAVAGCTIIDQRTFRRPPPPPPPAVAGPPAPPPPREGPPALVIIHPEAGLDLKAALRGPVEAARARKPNVLFEVASVVPPDGLPLTVPPPPATRLEARHAAPVGKAAEGLAALAGPAETVAKVIAGFGVPAARIEMSDRTDPGAPAPEIRVYVQ